MKKRYLIGGAYGLAASALAARLWARPREIDWAAERATMHHPERSRFVETADGLLLHYQEAGEEGARPVILIHGFCASTFVWSDVLLPLAAAGLRAIALDLVGFGFSAKPREGAYTIEAQARAVTGLMDCLQIERATLVGSSYGGAVAMACALDRPERVERLVVVGGIADNELKDDPLMRLGASPVVGDLLSPVLLGSRRLHRWRMKDVYGSGNGELLGAGRLAAHHRPLRAASTHRAVLATLRRWDARRIGREAGRIRQPVLLIWGDRDRAVPLRHGLHFLSEIPQARLFVFRRCGHLPQEEYPREFVGLVAPFCREGIVGRYGS